MANVVNLNRYRKKRARDEREKTAEASRVKHGRTKEERLRERLERERDAAALASKRLDAEDEKDGLEGD